MRTKHLVWLSVCALMVTMAACTSKTCRIEVSIDGANDGDTLLLITDQEFGIPSDTLIVKDGKTFHEMEIDSTMICFLQAVNSAMPIQPFFLEPGNIKVELHHDPTQNTVSGTMLNEEWQHLNEAGFAIQKEMEQLMSGAESDTTEAHKQEIINKAMAIQKKFSDNVFKTAEKNIDNELGFLLVSNPNMLNEEQVLMLINKMPAKMRSRQQIKEIEHYLKDETPQADGTKLTDFATSDPNGKNISAMEVVGKHKLTIIDFWASWCGPCMQEMPHLVQLYELYEPKGLGILGVSLDNEKSEWTDAIKKTGSKWTHISELTSDSKIARLFGVTAIPFTLVVDQEGTILASGHLTGTALEDVIRQYLKD